MNKDNFSPAFLYCRDQERKRRKAAEDKEAADKELLLCAESAAIYLQGHVTLPAITLHDRLICAIDEYRRVHGLPHRLIGVQQAVAKTA